MEHLLMFCLIFLYLQKGLTTEEYCEETRNVSGNVGGEVVLPVHEIVFQDITWMTDRDQNVFASTEQGKPVTIRSQLYDGRLNVTTNGSLIISKLTEQDRGIYKGSVLRRTSGQCAQFYNLTVYEEEGFFFSSPSTLSPIRNSTGAKTTKSNKQVSVWISIILCVSATAALVLIFIVTIIVSSLKTGACSKEDELLYTDLDINRLQKVHRERNVPEQNVIYSNLNFAKKSKKNNV